MAAAVALRTLGLLRAAVIFVIADLGLQFGCGDPPGLPGVLDSALCKGGCRPAAFDRFLVWICSRCMDRTKV